MEFGTCVGVAYLEVPLDQGYLKIPSRGLLFARSEGGLWHAACICHSGQVSVVCQRCLILSPPSDWVRIFLGLMGHEYWDEYWENEA